MEAIEEITINSLQEFQCFISYLLSRMKDPVKEKRELREVIKEKMYYGEKYAEEIIALKSPDSMSTAFKERMGNLIEYYVTEKNVSASDYIAYTEGNSYLKDAPYRFIGREKDLKKLADYFLDKKIDKPTPYLITMRIKAPGGQGKTALAREYANRYSSHYSAALEVDCESNVNEQIINFALNNDIAAEDSGEMNPKAVSRYINRLGKRFPKRILIIFDNLSTKNKRILKDVGDIIKGADSRYIHCLITSREKLLSMKLKQLDLNPLDKRDAADLFVDRVGIKDWNADDPLVIELTTRVLGGHALSIAIIASYVREHGVTDLKSLVEEIENYGIVNQSEATNTIVEEYGKSLFVALELSFNAIGESDRDSQLLFLLLSMFPRYMIPLKIIKSCAGFMDVKHGSGLEELKGDLIKKGNKPRPLNVLVSHSLIEQHKPDKDKKHEVAYQFHEVLYDYACYKWVQFHEQEEFDLECCELILTNSVCECASENIGDYGIKYEELLPLVGFLVPSINEERGYVPSYERVAKSLYFWFENYRFHQFVYDTEIQELLLPNLEKIRSYLDTKDLLDTRSEIILNKLIGHAYYGSPEDKGEEAHRLLSRAYDLVKEMKDGKEDGDLSWYLIFLKDHMVNVLSKARPDEKQVIPLCLDEGYADQIREIESELPSSLVSLNEKPDEFSLLLRSAHYWGHRGNQDSYTLYKQLVLKKTNSNTPGLIEESGAHYIKAINYRMAALRLFKSTRHTLQIENKATKWEELTWWVGEIGKEEGKTKVEKFTSLYQGIGDIAHQYRGLNYVFLIEALLQLVKGESTFSVEKIRHSYSSARYLWDKADKARGKNEVPIKYQMWMCGCAVINDLVLGYIKNKHLPPKDEVKNRVDKSVREFRDKLTGGYSYGSEAQSDQVEELWGVLDRVSNGVY